MGPSIREDRQVTERWSTCCLHVEKRLARVLRPGDLTLGPAGISSRTSPIDSFTFWTEGISQMHTQFTQAVVRFLNNEDGPTAVEYAVMLALIIVVCITAITALGSNANKTFTSVSNTIGGTAS